MVFQTLFFTNVVGNVEILCNEYRARTGSFDLSALYGLVDEIRG